MGQQSPAGEGTPRVRHTEASSCPGPRGGSGFGERPLYAAAAGLGLPALQLAAEGTVCREMRCLGPGGYPPSEKPCWANCHMRTLGSEGG